MIDGTDVENVIRKKRAHKTILAEAFESQNKNLFKLKKRKAAPVTKLVEDEGSGGGETAVQNDQGSLAAELADLDGSGYIIESGNIITIEKIALESVNKSAINVIQH